MSSLVACGTPRPTGRPFIYRTESLPVAWFVPWERSGTVTTDLTENRFVGTINGAVSWSQGPDGPCLSGFTGGSATTTYVDLGNSKKLNPTAAMSLVVDVTATSVASPAELFLARDDNTLGRAYTLGLQNGAFDLEINGTSVFPLSMAAVAGNRYFLAATGSPSAGWTGYLYAAGSKRSLAASWVAPATTTGATCIGRRTYSTSQYGLVGSLHSAAIYDYCLTPAQVAREYADPYWRLRRPSRSASLSPPPPSPAGTANDDWFFGMMAAW